MKHLKTPLLFLLLAFSFNLCTSAYNDILSPAIDIIKNKTSFVKSGTVQSDVVFTAEDFDKGFGIKVKEITVQTLPPVKDGILKIAGTAAISGQSVPRAKIGTMKFVPNAKGASRCDFTVYHSGDPKTALKCTVSLGEGINFSPAATENTFSTLSNVSLVKNLTAYDPENDELYYEIVSSPENGILTLTSCTGGGFIYQPKNNFCGNDSFEYRVCDTEGNFSENESDASIIVHDVLVSGAQLEESMKIVGSKTKITGIFCLVNRLDYEGREKLATEYGIPIFSLLDLKDENIEKLRS